MELRIINFTSKAEERHKLFIPDIQRFLRNKFKPHVAFGQDNLLYYGIYKRMGWMYDFRPYLKRFLVKQYDSWQEYYCINKTALQKLLHGKIQEIIEVKNEHSDRTAQGTEED